MLRNLLDLLHGTSLAMYGVSDQGITVSTAQRGEVIVDQIVKESLSRKPGALAQSSLYP